MIFLSLRFQAFWSIFELLPFFDFEVVLVLERNLITCSLMRLGRRSELKPTNGRARVVYTTRDTV